MGIYCCLFIKPGSLFIWYILLRHPFSNCNTKKSNRFYVIWTDLYRLGEVEWRKNIICCSNTKPKNQIIPTVSTRKLYLLLHNLVPPESKVQHKT